MERRNSNANKLDDMLYYLPERQSKDYFGSPRPDVLASFDHICSDYAGSVGRFQSLLIIVCILLGYSFFQEEIVINVIYPRQDVQKLDFLCIPEHDYLTEQNFSYNLIKGVMANVQSPCWTYNIRQRLFEASYRENVRAKIMRQELVYFLSKNKSIHSNFAAQVKCYDQEGSRITFNPEGWKTAGATRMVTLLEQFQLVCFNNNLTQIFAHPLTYYSAMTTVGCLMLGPLADLFGRYKVARFVTALLFINTISPATQNYVGFVWSNILCGFKDYPLFFLSLITVMENTTWRHRAKFLAFASTSQFMIFPVDVFSRSFFNTWRLYYFVFTIPGLIIWILFSWRFVESARWQLAKGLLKEATEGLVRISHINSRRIKQDDLAMDVEAVIETEFPNVDTWSFLRYVKIQKRVYTILHINWLIVTFYISEQNYFIVRFRAEADDTLLAFVLLASTILTFATCFFMYPRLLYNKPVFGFCVVGTLWYSTRIVFWFIKGAPEYSDDENKIYFLIEQFLNAYIGDVLFYGLILQIIHSSPTIYRATWTLSIVGLSAFIAPLFRSLGEASFTVYFFLEKVIICVLYLLGAIFQKTWMPVINPHVNEMDLLSGANLTWDEGYVLYDITSKNRGATASSSGANRHRPTGKCC